MKVLDPLYHPGSARHEEDGHFSESPFFGVLDGVSEPHSPDHPARLFNGLSSGAMMARMTEGLAKSFHPDMSLDDVTDLLLERFKQKLEEHNFPLHDPGAIPGYTFAFAKVGDHEVETIQAGDCFALYELRDGTVLMNPNQVRLHDTEMNDIILRIQREVAWDLFEIELEAASREQKGKITGEMWNRFRPILVTARRKDVNNPKSRRQYGILNGQKELKDFLFRRVVSRDDLKTLILFTDGMVPWEAMKGMSDETVGREVLANYHKGGLPYQLAIARGIEKKVANVNYTDSAEATAVAIEF